MNTRNLLNISLLIVVVLLAVIAVFAPQSKTPPADYLVTGDAAAVDKISIRQNTDTVSFHKQDARWFMDTPYHTRANDARLETLLEIFTTRALSRFSAGTDLAKYGFDAQTARVSYNDIVVQFGDTEPLQHRRYVLYQNEIALIDGDFKYLLTQAPENFLYRGLVPDQALPVYFALPELTLELDADSWRVTGTGISYSQEQVTALVNEWRYSQAQRISRAAQDKTDKSIDIRLADGSSRHYLLTVNDQETRFIDPALGVQYHFGNDIAKRLLTPAAPSP